jgi:hypothetical protein
LQHAEFEVQVPLSDEQLPLPPAGPLPVPGAPPEPGAPPPPMGTHIPWPPQVKPFRQSADDVQLWAAAAHTFCLHVCPFLQSASVVHFVAVDLLELELEPEPHAIMTKARPAPASLR